MTRSLFIIILSLCILLPAMGQDQSYADCLVKAASSWGKPCDKCEIYTGYKRDFTSVYQVEFRNVCGELLEVKVAMEEDNGTWRTFPVKVLAGGETLAAYACRGTGKYMYWARRVNDTEIVLPSDGQIASAYSAQ
ncbi:MAG TPA: hypothetical protein PKD45_09730 [Flavobacteriales bacterium]|nr:hypothetical protein [Flavobacteriales bacterium]